MINRRAIVLFVRDERREAALKPLPAPYRRAGYRSLNRRVAARLAPLIAEGVDIIIAGERAPAMACTHHIMQRGNGFGERITNAIVDAHALGYRDVVAVGNDCPTIAAADVAAAFAALTDGATLAAAPTRDGGAFLIAARSGGFHPSLFAALPWRTGRLFTALRALPGAVALEILRDDFDAWSAPSALAALAALYGHRSPAPTLHLPPAPARPRRRMKALSRIHLPAPPAP